MNKKHNRILSHSISLCPIWPTQASDKIGKMLQEINQANTIINKVASTAQNSAIKGGFAAETWHAESFNLDAILKDKDVRSFTDNFTNSPLAKNHLTHDIVVMKGDEQILGAQLKYYKDGESTQKAFRATEDGIVKYKDSDAFIGPADQIDQIKAAAEKDIRINGQTRSEVAEAAEAVRDKISGNLDVDGAQSTPLSKRDAESLGKGNKEGKELHESMQKEYLNKSTVQQSLRAAKSAAVITTVIAGSINTFQSIKRVRDGEITAEQATFEILQNTAVAAGDSALKAGVATATVSMTARNLPTLFAGSAFKRAFANNGVAAGAVCAVDVVQNVVLFAAGKITREELETRSGQNLLQSGAGVAGSSVGAAVGALGGPAGALIGAIIGGLITSMAMSIAIDNHIERNFRLTLEATESVASNTMIMHEALEYLQVSQAFYAEFHKGLYLSERHFDNQVKTMADQSTQLKNLIDNL
ncbi:hypothetical protein MRM63_09940 [bacterium 19MO03SA05]|uniref:hypothetical protein n=1 Tax=Vibrio TaxID=662 RepID=UPI0027C98EFE|nr:MULTISPECIES: hypothetical protein [unclassified Vibrio]EKO3921865.1 hypothetical protein [Vibrio metschnikovii]MDQ2110125.1 hypothetical protein [Vibrio sp. 2017_1457_15]MDQ2162927.1 hypothetical protein [Vibrio sp. 2017_1457_13]MDQ2194721.1 hypothetical protein [Vibrio sp. A14(2019)]